MAQERAQGVRAPIDAMASVDTGDDSSPGLAARAGGPLVSVWSSDDPRDGLGSDLDLLHAQSNDLDSWSDPLPIDPVIMKDMIGDDDFDPQVDTGNGVWIVVWWSHTDVHFSRSTDGGVTWSRETTIHPDFSPEDDERPHLATNGRGTWIVVWQHRAGGEFDIALSSSKNDG